MPIKEALRQTMALLSQTEAVAAFGASLAR